VAQGGRAVFTDVLRNAEKQREHYSALNNGSEIEFYYPELHASDLGGFFTNTSGSLLIPDLVSSPHLVVDLYDFASEEALIARYGVDKAFLVSLRDAGHITVAANLLPDRYASGAWMHDILADPRTIFRSIRTPLYFEKQAPKTIGNQQKLAAALVAAIGSLSDDAFLRLVATAKIGVGPADRIGLAEQLAWRLARINALTRESSTPIDFDPDEIVRSPDALPILNRDHFLIVSPISAGLGGTVRVSEESFRRMFSDADRVDVLNSENVLLSRINAFLMRKRLELEASDLTGLEYWKFAMTQFGRREIIERLSRRGKRAQLMAAERNLRRRIAKMDNEVTLEEVEAAVEDDSRRLAYWGPMLNAGYRLVYSGFCYQGYKYAEGKGYGTLGATLGGAAFLAGEIVKAKAIKVVEFALPRIQVANCVRRKR
jgi:hypothetical protein